jgi:hypothetical protein
MEVKGSIPNIYNLCSCLRGYLAKLGWVVQLPQLHSYLPFLTDLHLFSTYLPITIILFLKINLKLYYINLVIQMIHCFVNQMTDKKLPSNLNEHVKISLSKMMKVFFVVI